MKDLKGKVALVTGGSRGLGAAICKTLGKDGVTVVSADLRYREVKRSDGCPAMELPLDITDRMAVAEAVRRVIQSFGKLDILINNAGTDVTKSVEEVDFDEWDRVIDVNLRAPFVLSKIAFPIMRKNGGGHIVNITSTAAKRAWPNASAYHASKWGLLGFSHALGTEGKEAGIKVTAIVTGGMRTPFLLDRFPDIDVSTLQDPANVAEQVKYVLKQPDDCCIPELMVMPKAETSWP